MVCVLVGKSNCPCGRIQVSTGELHVMIKTVYCIKLSCLALCIFCIQFFLYFLIMMLQTLELRPSILEYVSIN